MMRWQGGQPETISGRGSTREYTRGIQAPLSDLIYRLGIKTIFDAGCGDQNWIRRVDLNGAQYHGMDLPEYDIVQDVMPAVDLVICRDVLIHLNMTQIKKINWRGTYRLVTYYPGGGNLSSIEGHRLIDPRIAPLSWGDPLEVIQEQTPGKYLGLWKW